MRHRAAIAPSAMKPGEMQRHLIRLGFTIEQAAYALGCSYEHVRALLAGRDRITEKVAGSLQTMTLTDASNVRLEWWEKEGFAKRRAVPVADRSQAHEQETDDGL